MSEFEPTNFPAFHNFLLENSARIEDERRQGSHALRQVLPNDEIIEEHILRNALHFMEDIHIFHEEWVDNFAENPEEFADEEELTVAQREEMFRKTATAINYTMDQILTGNGLVIAVLSDLEIKHNAQYGVKPYSAATKGDWDAWNKWDDFRSFAEPDIPDLAPQS